MKADRIKAHLIYNPSAGPRDVRRSIERVCSFLERHGWSIELHVTEEPGNELELARAAARAGCDVAIVAGGDGTVSRAVNGLAGTRTALGVLPTGTGNLWAKQLGIPTYTLTNPMRLQDAAADLLKGTVRCIDVGQVNDRYFLCWAGIGLDAQVTKEMEPRPRHTKRLGALPYVIAAILVARDFKGVRTRVSLDGKTTRGRTLLILASNIRQYGGVLNVAREAKIDDGLLDVFIFKGLGLPYVVRHVLKIITMRHLQDPRVVHRQARHVEVHTEPVVPVQVDGDPVGSTPVTLKVVPRILHVLIPPTAPASLFASSATQARR